MIKSVKKIIWQFFNKREKALPQVGSGGFLQSTSPLDDIPCTKHDMSVPRYPPPRHGYPSKSVEELTESQIKLVSQVRKLVGDDVFNEYCFEIINRYAAYVHLLPASQNHHHRGQGGLFRHGLDVAVIALKQAVEIMAVSISSPQHRRADEKRWLLAIFVAALLHDVGKIFSNFIVTNRDGNLKWKPFHGTLYAWIIENKLEEYVIYWNGDRGRKHESYGWTVFNDILGEEIISLISEDLDIYLWMGEVIISSPTSSNWMFEIVANADKSSVELDLKAMGSAVRSVEPGVPKVERFLIDIMRNMVSDRYWRVNEPGARIWIIQGCMFLVWPSGCNDIATQLKRVDIPGVPRTPESIADMLIERNILVLNITPEGGKSRYWMIAPSCLTQNNPAARLKALRFRDVDLLIDFPPASVQGTVFGECFDSESRQAQNVPSKNPEPNSSAITKDIIASTYAVAIETPTGERTISAPARHTSPAMDIPSPDAEPIWRDENSALSNVGQLQQQNNKKNDSIDLLESISRGIQTGVLDYKPFEDSEGRWVETELVFSLARKCLNAGVPGLKWMEKNQLPTWRTNEIEGKTWVKIPF